MNKFRTNILGLAVIGGALISVLALATTGEAELATLAVAGTVVGGLAGVMVWLSEPEPDPSVPSSIVEQILRVVGASLPADQAAAIRVTATESSRRPNVIVLTLIGAVLVGALIWVLPSESAIVTVAGGFIGGLVSLAGKLVEPEPNPSVPASVVAKLLEKLSATA